MTELERELRELAESMDQWLALPDDEHAGVVSNWHSELRAILARFGGGEAQGAGKDERAVQLLESWLKDPTNYDEETWPELKRYLGELEYRTRDLTDLRRENERLKEGLEAAEDLVEKWQYASGLIGGCGDPSGIKPEHAEKHWVEVEKQLAEAKEGLAESIESRNAMHGRWLDLERIQDRQLTFESVAMELAEEREHSAKLAEELAEVYKLVETPASEQVDALETQVAELAGKLSTTETELAAHQWIPLEGGTELPECDLEVLSGEGSGPRVFSGHWLLRRASDHWEDDHCEGWTAGDIVEIATHYRRFVPPEK